MRRWGISYFCIGNQDKGHESGQLNGCSGASLRNFGRATAQWTAQQIVEAFPFDTAPSYLIRDGDGIYGERVTRRIESLGIDEVIRLHEYSGPTGIAICQPLHDIQVFLKNFS